MKKGLSLVLLVFLLIFSFASCNGKKVTKTYDEVLSDVCKEYPNSIIVYKDIKNINDYFY